MTKNDYALECAVVCPQCGGTGCMFHRPWGLGDTHICSLCLGRKKVRAVILGPAQIDSSEAENG